MQILISYACNDSGPVTESIKSHIVHIVNCYVDLIGSVHCNEQYDKRYIFFGAVT